jgi:hypothetical protein
MFTEMSKSETRSIFDDEVRDSIVKKVLLYFFIIALLVLVVTGAIAYSRYRDESISKGKSRIISELLDKIDHGDLEQRKEAIEYLSDISDGKTAYSAMASFYLAQLHMMENDPSKIIAEYDKVSSNASYPEYMRYYAALSAISAKVMYGMIDNEEASKALDGLMNASSFPFKLSANLLKSVLISSYDIEKANIALSDLVRDAEFLESAAAMAKAMKHYNIVKGSIVQNSSVHSNVQNKKK